MIATAGHVVPAADFTALARGGGGPAAVRRLAAAELSRTMLLVRALVDLSERTGHEHAAATRSAFGALAELQRDAPDAVTGVLAYPAVGAWAMRTTRSLRAGRPRAARPERLAAVLAAAAIRAGASLDVCLPSEAGAAGHAVMLPSLGLADLSPDGLPRRSVVVRCRPLGTEVVAGSVAVRLPADPASDATRWRGLRRLALEPGREPLIDDLDRYRYPDSAQAAGRLGAVAMDRWQALLGAGWRLLRHDHPQVAAEVAAAVRVFTPLLDPPRGQSSATTREAFGSVALSTPHDAVAAAVTLAHEIQHAKLTALMDLYRMAAPGSGRLFYAPWRDDPRPTRALLQGAYAHLGVASFWRRRRRLPDGDAAAALYADTEFARWRDAALDTTEVLLDSGELAEIGLRFATGMRETLAGWRAEPVPAGAAARARRLAVQHRTRWLRAHSP